MSLITENVIPGNHGRIFGTDASTDEQMDKIKVAIEKVDGVKDVVPIQEIFPKEFIVRTSKLVRVASIEDAVQHLELHCVPKGIFPVLEQ